MIKTFLGAVAVVAAGAPATVGLAGNSSFSQAVPVRTPEHATSAHAAGATSPRPVGTARDDHSGRVGRRRRDAAT